PGPAPRQDPVPVGPEHRHGHGDASDHRLPVADGALLLADGAPRRARLGGRAPLARDALVRRWRRRRLPHPDLAGRARARRPAPVARLVVSPAVVVAAFAYMLSPYVLDYAARISVILMPWAGLPWLIAFTARSLRGPTWRSPAVFALTVVTIGGVNATALLLA